MNTQIEEFEDIYEELLAKKMDISADKKAFLAVELHRNILYARIADILERALLAGPEVDHPNPLEIIAMALKEIKKK